MPLTIEYRYSGYFSSNGCDAILLFPGFWLLSGGLYKPIFGGAEDILFKVFFRTLIDFAKEAGQVRRAVHGVQVIITGQDVRVRNKEPMVSFGRFFRVKTISGSHDHAFEDTGCDPGFLSDSSPGNSIDRSYQCHIFSISVNLGSGVLHKLRSQGYSGTEKGNRMAGGSHWTK